MNIFVCKLNKIRYCTLSGEAVGIAVKCRKTASALTLPCHAYLGCKDELVHIGSQKWLRDNFDIQLKLFPDGTHFGYSQQEKQQMENDLAALMQQM